MKKKVKEGLIEETLDEIRDDISGCAIITGRKNRADCVAECLYYEICKVIFHKERRM